MLDRVFLGASSSSENYWIGLFGGADAELYGDVTVDTTGNVYITCFSNPSGTANAIICKINSSGIVQWQRRLIGASGDGIAVDSSGNVYVVGDYSAANDCFIAKYDNAGTLLWQRKYGDAATNDYSEGVGIDSSGNVYLGGWTNSGSDNDINIVKYNNSGALQWQRRFGYTGTPVVDGTRIAVDASGNVYITGKSDYEPGASYNIIMAKYDTSGALQWQRALRTTDFDGGTGISVDNSGNVYISGFIGSSLGVIAKYNSSGTLQWQRTINAAIFNDIVSDTVGNTYIVGRSGSFGAYDIFIAKYNTSGSLQWQRSLSSSGSDEGTKVSLAPNGSICIIGSTNVGGTNDIILAKLRDDGSLTGTYSVNGFNFTYSQSSFTEQAGTATGSSPNILSGAGTIADAAGTLTDAVSTIPLTVTPL